MSSDLALVIGFMGMAMSFCYRIPQIVKLHRTKGYKDISTWMIHLQNLSYVFYVIYAIMIGDVVNLVSSLVSTAQNLLLLIMIRAYSGTHVANENLSDHP